MWQTVTSYIMSLSHGPTSFYLLLTVCHVDSYGKGCGLLCGFRIFDHLVTKIVSSKTQVMSS